MKRKIYGLLVSIVLYSNNYAAGLTARQIPKVKPIEACGYTLREIKTEEQLERLVRDIRAQGKCAIDTETTGFRPLHGDSIIGLSICTKKGEAWYVHCQQAGLGSSLSFDKVKAELGPVFADPEIKKHMHNARYDLAVLFGHDLPVQGLAFDTMIAAQVFGRAAGLKVLSEDLLNEEMLSFSHVVKNRGFPDYLVAYLSDQQNGDDIAAQYACADALQTFRLVPILTKMLKQKPETWEHFKKVEVPLVAALSNMECRGLRCDKPRLVDVKQGGVAKKSEDIIDKLIRAYNPNTGCVHAVFGPTHLATRPTRHNKTFVVAEDPADDMLIREAIIAPDGYEFVGAFLEAEDKNKAYKEAVALFEQERFKERLDAYTALQVNDQWVVASTLACVAQTKQLMGEVVEDIPGLEFALPEKPKRRRGATDRIFKVGETWAQVSSDE